MSTHQTTAPAAEGKANAGAVQTPAAAFEPEPANSPAPRPQVSLREQIPTLPGKVDGIIGAEPARLQCRECGAIWTNEEMVGGRDCWPLIFIESGYGFHRHDPEHPRRLCRGCLTAARDAHGCSEGTR